MLKTPPSFADAADRLVARAPGTATAEGYMSGFGNDFETEALPGALPVGRNSPQRCPYGLYAEQLSGSPFTAPRHANERSWLYRILPSVKHLGRLKRIDVPHWRTAPERHPDVLSLGQYRWNPPPFPDGATLDFVDGMRSMTLCGDADARVGMGAHVYLVNAPMKNRYMHTADGELLVIPQSGRMRFDTEFGRIDVEPLEIAILPRGMTFSASPLDEEARGFVCENYGAKLALPPRGPIGANCLANPRDFKTPVAAFENRDINGEMIVKWGGEFHRAPLNRSPLDVVAWHGNYAPCKYDLRTFAAVGSVTFDHPDPSIFTALTSAGADEGGANVDFIVFPPRWQAQENTFRPPWYHKNVMSELMGNLCGQYDAKPSGFEPGALSLHNCMLPHGPDAEAFDKASREGDDPVKLEGGMAFMLETCLPQRLTEFAARHAPPQDDYVDCWKDLDMRFDGSPQGRWSD